MLKNKKNGSLLRKYSNDVDCYTYSQNIEMDIW